MIDTKCGIICIESKVEQTGQELPFPRSIIQKINFSYSYQADKVFSHPSFPQDNLYLYYNRRRVVSTHLLAWLCRHSRNENMTAGLHADVLPVPSETGHYLLAGREFVSNQS